MCKIGAEKKAMWRLLYGRVNLQRTIRSPLLLGLSLRNRAHTRKAPGIHIRERPSFCKYFTECHGLHCLSLGTPSSAHQLTLTFGDGFPFSVSCLDSVSKHVLSSALGNKILELGLFWTRIQISAFNKYAFLDTLGFLNVSLISISN